MLNIIAASEIQSGGGRSLAIGQSSVLIVEDNVLIALDLEYILQSYGVGEVAIAGTVDEALRLMATRRFDAAVLDVKIGDTTTLAVAIALSKLNVPFAYVTGSDLETTVPEEYWLHPLIKKPFQTASVECVLIKLILPGQGG